MYISSPAHMYVLCTLAYPGGEGGRGGGGGGFRCSNTSLPFTRATCRIQRASRTRTTPTSKKPSSVCAVPPPPHVQLNGIREARALIMSNATCVVCFFCGGLTCTCAKSSCVPAHAHKFNSASEERTLPHSQILEMPLVQITRLNR